MILSLHYVNLQFITRPFSGLSSSLSLSLSSFNQLDQTAFLQSPFFVVYEDMHIKTGSLIFALLCLGVCRFGSDFLCIFDSPSDCSLYPLIIFIVNFSERIYTKLTTHGSAHGWKCIHFFACKFDIQKKEQIGQTKWQPDLEDIRSLKISGKQVE